MEEVRLGGGGSSDNSDNTPGVAATAAEGVNNQPVPVWDPQPIDTTNVSLPDDLKALIEMLAENAHDHWGRQRISEKWSHGPERSDKLRTTPLLVPYAKLPESEKDYDRNLAAETLKVIIKLGYQVTI
jgi:hypothetical protein